jgi:hypothetical protein
MPLSPDEALKLALEAEEVFQTIRGALKKDEDGKVRVSRAETKKIILGLTKLAADFAREYLD